MTSRLNEVDFNCYWKLTDALIAYTRTGKYGDVAFGNTPGQRSLGLWPDGKPIKELEVILPATEGMVSKKILESAPGER